MLAGKIISLVILCVATLLHIVSLLIDNKKIEAISKCFIVPSILSFYLFSTNTINWLYFVALITAFVGDVILLNRSKNYLQFGGYFFGITQILLIVILFMTINYPITPLWMLFIIPIIYVAIGITFMCIFVRRFYTKLMQFLSATTYIAANGLSSALGLILLITIPCAQTAFYFIGATCFFISDCILLFKRNNPEPSFDRKEIIIILSYICAQFFICMAVIY